MMHRGACVKTCTDQTTLELSLARPSMPRAQLAWVSQFHATQLTKLETALTDLQSKLGKRPYITRATVEKRVASILRRHPARAYLRVTVQDRIAEEPLAL